MSSHRELSLAVIQCTTPSQPAAALNHLLSLFRSLERTTDLIFLPETVNSIGAEDPYAVATTESEDPVLSWLKSEAKRRQQAMIVGSVCLRDTKAAGKLVNRSLYLDNQGQIIARYDKVHLFDAKVGEGSNHSYKESHNFTAGNQAMIVKASFGNIGMSVCYDVRQPALYRQLALAGADIFSVPAAFTVPTGQKHWRILLQARAIENGSFVVAPAQCGQHTDQRQTWGHSMVIDPDGKVVLDAGNQPGVHYVTIDLDAVAQARQNIPALHHGKTVPVATTSV